MIFMKGNKMKLKIINFNQVVLNVKDYNNRYVRKIISVEENKGGNSKHRYGIVKESIYFTDAECNCVNCDNGDYFIICDQIKEIRIGTVINIYYLVMVDFKRNKGFRIVNCLCRIPEFDSFPFAENILVEYLINLDAVLIED